MIPRELIRSESFIIDQICKEMKRLSVKTLEAFVKANGKNHKPITEIKKGEKMKLADFDFRIWNKDEETLTYASKDYKLDIGFSNPQQDYGVCESELHAYYDGEPMCPSDCEIELWSGFYDCKGKKIYEGDIVKYASNTRPLVVVYERNTFYIIDTSIEKDLQVDCGTRLQGIYYNKGIYDNRSNGYTNQKIECLEVLGNIHENADLLEEEKVFIKKCKYADIECLCGK